MGARRSRGNVWLPRFEQRRSRPAGLLTQLTPSERAFAYAWLWLGILLAPAGAILIGLGKGTRGLGVGLLVLAVLVLAVPTSPILKSRVRRRDRARRTLD